MIIRCSLLFLAMLFACSGDRRYDGGTPSAENDDRACVDGFDNDDDGFFDCDDPGCASVEACIDDPIDDRECAYLTARAEVIEVPLDVIWAVDVSASMIEESSHVQTNLNTFSGLIDAAGIDHHVVMISSVEAVRIPSPLGDDDERFLFIDEPIYSANALERLNGLFHQYESFLRKGAVTHFVVVSDSDSGMRPESFEATMSNTLGGSFVFHAIASEPPTPGELCFDPEIQREAQCVACTGSNGSATEPGERYYALADITGGESLSVCAENWSVLFDSLREAVVRSVDIPCAFALPEPPEGRVFDADRVDVVFFDDRGEGRSLARAVAADRCGRSEAWIFDRENDPTRIELCDVACELVSASTNGRLDIVLGCEPEVILY